MSRSLVEIPQGVKGRWDFLGACILRPGQAFPWRPITDKHLDAGTISKSNRWFVLWRPDYAERVSTAHTDSISVVVIGSPWISQSAREEKPAAYIASRLHNNTPLTNLLAQMDGEYLLMVWDDTAQTGVIATDPVGRSTVYYHASNGQVIWASHPETVAILGGKEVQIDQQSLNAYFALKGVPAPWSMVKDVSKLPPGHVLTLKDPVEIRGYFSLKKSRFDRSFTEAQEELIHGLRCSIERCSKSSGFQTLGIFLSGGIDSATLAAIARELTPVCAFSVGYFPHYYTDETKESTVTASSLGVPIKICRFSPADAINLLDKTAAYLPEPVADMALLPEVFLASYASQFVKLVLDGTGADAILGGSNKFIAEFYRRFYMGIPRVLRRGLIYPLLQFVPTSRRWPLTNRLRQLAIFVKGAEIPSVEERALFWSTFFPYTLLQKVLLAEWMLDQDIAVEILRDLLQEYGDQESISSISHMTLRGITAGVELPKLAAVERISGIFIHTPFLSSEVITLAFSLPDSFKVSGAYGKIVLREAARRIVPPQVLQRRKKNFSPPIGQWLTNQLREIFWETLASGEEIFNIDTLRRMWWEQRAGYRDWTAELWAIFMFQRWWNQVRTGKGIQWHWNG